MKDINKLEKTEYLEGANLALENAKAHLEIANLSANSKQYGIGTSLLVFAIEELAKASVLKLKSINNEIPINNLDKYFYNHEIKHKSIIKVFYSSLGLSDEKTSTPTNKDNIITLVIIIAICYYCIKNKTHKNKSIKNKSEYDIIKESGFYFSYSMDDKKWISPKDIHNKESYSSFKEHIVDFFEIIETSLFSEKINTSNIILFAETMDDVINQEELSKLKATLNKNHLL